MIKKIAYSILASLPVILFAFSSGPPIKRTGAAVDGGTNCSVCHANLGAANSDPKGSVTIDVAGYTPGVTQTVKVTVKHPEQSRWGFQITARLVSDENKQAGTFAVNDVVRVRCDSSPAHDAPCNGDREFPEHKDAPVTGVGEGFTFQVDWTPPATDVGDIVFYAAGNAANNDHNLTGDHIYTTSKTISSAACSLTGKPAITSVLNGASFLSSMASNTMATIFGQNLGAAGTSRVVSSGDILNNAFPKQLACVAVEIDGKRVPLAFVRPDQINVESPTTASRGPVSVKVILNPDLPNQSASDAATVQMADVAPAFFTFNGKSVAAQFANTANLVADPAVVTGAKQAKAGDIITLYGTGLGATDQPLQSGDIATGIARITGTPAVTIGGVSLSAADIIYCGLSPGSISGLYQINVRVPAGTGDGDIPVSFQVGGLKTQDGATIPIKN